LGIRLFRPWPGPEVLKALKNVKAVAVLDRATSLGAPGTTLYEDVATTLYALPKQPTLTNYVYGLGGRDIRTRDIVKAVRETLKLASDKKKVSPIKFLGVRE
jgi:pyruvate ferredoxin oxidoreductase alpha subunit